MKFAIVSYTVLAHKKHGCSIFLGEVRGIHAAKFKVTVCGYGYIGIDGGELPENKRGIHIFSRALPKNYFLSQILSWEETKKHKAWLISWEETELCDAVYEDDIAKISFKHSKNGKMKIIIGVREMPCQVLLNGIMTEFVQINNEKIEICPMIDGILEIIF